MQAALKLSRAARLARVPRRGARPALAAAERELCRRRRQHRLHRRRPRAGAQAGATTCAAWRRRRAGTQRYDWAGYIPFEQLPRAFNPPGGAVVLANHKIVPPKYPHHITYEWQPPFRAQRIEQLLGARSTRHDSFHV